MNGKSCATCEFCVPDITNIGQGFCHRNPPTAFMIPNPYGQQAALASAHPPVIKATEWCAEYKPGLVTGKDDKKL
jgi:hypothetical protein